MKRIWVLALTLCVLLGISRIATAHESPVILTLDEALARVEYHSDYQAWGVQLGKQLQEHSSDPR